MKYNKSCTIFVYSTIKRAFDVILSAVGLLVFSSIMATIATAIKLESGGPILYRGERIGMNGKKFRILKFRTMRVGSEAKGTTTAKDDPRITRIGHRLRKLKLDELPQLLNVLRGEMSIVGPRPEVQEHTDAYSDKEMQILTVLPGITDYSSIRFVNLNDLVGNENPHHIFLTEFRDEKNQLRLRYVQNRCFKEDIKIIFQTLETLVKMSLIKERHA